MIDIDINSDLGEGFGPYQIADDDALLNIVSSANIACGFHAGDPVIMDETVRIAAQRGVDIGAHIGFADRMGFGRRQIQIDHHELEKMALYQLGALHAIAAAHGRKVSHVSAHGALGNLSFVNREIADSLMRAVKSFDPTIVIVTLANTEAERAAKQADLRVARLFLADRAYDDRGLLVSRKLDGAVIKDLSIVTKRVIEILTERTVTTISGQKIDAEVDSILVHSDTPGAVELGQAIQSAVKTVSGRITPLSKMAR
jgi:UPF0271 protein